VGGGKQKNLGTEEGSSYLERSIYHDCKILLKREDPGLELETSRSDLQYRPIEEKANWMGPCCGAVESFTNNEYPTKGDFVPSEGGSLPGGEVRTTLFFLGRFMKGKIGYLRETIEPRTRISGGNKAKGAYHNKDRCEWTSAIRLHRL